MHVQFPQDVSGKLKILLYCINLWVRQLWKMTTAYDVNFSTEVYQPLCEQTDADQTHPNMPSQEASSCSVAFQ